MNDGYITWRYWLRRVKEVHIGVSEEYCNRASKPESTSSKEQSVDRGEQDDDSPRQELPCRITIEARGLEWFIYNRSPAYDTIVSSLKNQKDSIHFPNPTSLKGESKLDAPPKSSSFDFPVEEKVAPSSIREDDFDEKSRRSTEPQDAPLNKPLTKVSVKHHDLGTDQLPSFLSILPIGVKCDRGAILMGNEYTKCILVSKFDRVNGQVGARETQSDDLYRQTFDFNLIHPVVQLKPNKDYKGTQMEAAAKSRHVSEEAMKEQYHNWSVFDYCRIKRQALHSLHRLIPYLRRSVESVIPDKKGSRDPKSPDPSSKTGGPNKWFGLSRYLDDEEAGHVDQERWKAIEYGASETVLDSPELGVSFFWDVPGKVSRSEGAFHGLGDNINGSEPPDWGIELRLGGGHINYGPWADRQRSDLQNFFFPTLYQNATAVGTLEPGQTRVATVFKLRVEIEKPTIIRVPTREESKDWKWKGKAMAGDDLHPKNKTRKQSLRNRKNETSKLKPEIRPAGWLDMTVSEDTCISYTMDLFPSWSGYGNRLDLELRAPEMSSSVNHGLLWRSDIQTISCNLSVPLEWNKQRDWTFDICSSNLELFLLRDHIYLLIDLINDWTTGPPGEFYTFVPFLYSIRLQLPNFKFYLNANDSNIINNPSDVSDNTFIAIWGQELKANVYIPLINYQPLSNTITFDLDAIRGGLQLRTPSWNTQYTFLDNPNVATLKDLRVNGSYNYYTSTSPNLTDTCFLSVHGVEPTVHIYGFLIRYFLKLKDNYFGEDLHFQTLEEYQARVSKSSTTSAQPVEGVRESKLSNDLDVILSVDAENSCLMIPASLYSATENIKVEVSSILIDLRFTNYYMDLVISFSPLSVASNTVADSQVPLEVTDSRIQAFVDGLTVSGHRLFGLPPTEPTYVCNWDFEVGRVSGECSADFLRCLALALRCFTFSFSDAENALSLHKPAVIHDVTFLCAAIESIHVWVHVEHAALLLSSETVKINYNDWAGSTFSDQACITMPNIVLACVDGRTASRHRSGRYPNVITYAYINTTLVVHIRTTKSDFRANRQLQQDHICLHDSRTQRTAWLLHQTEDYAPLRPAERKVKSRPAAMPYPLMPEPMIFSDDFNTKALAVISRSLETNGVSRLWRRQNSLSTASSKQRSRTFIIQPSLSNSSLHKPVVNEDLIDALSLAPPARVRGARPVSVSPSSRKSSFQGVSPMTQQIGATLPPSSVNFSSPYEPPYFPLDKIDPNTQDVPGYPYREDSSLNRARDDPDESGLPLETDEGMAKTVLSFHLIAGLRAFCTPEALEHASNLASKLQPRAARSILDDLQMTIMSDVSSHSEARSAAKSTQIRFQLPQASVRFMNNKSIEPTVKQPVDDNQRQCYDLSTSRLISTLRLANQLARESKNGTGPEYLVHVEIEHLTISAMSSIERQVRDQAKVSAGLSRATMWAAIHPGLVGELQFQDLEVESFNRQVKLLTLLLKSTQMVYEKALDDFRFTASQYNQRCQQLVLSFSNFDTHLPDPVFLTSASNILRLAHNHPRLSDSWKMISRLRCSQQTLPRTPPNNGLSYLSNDDTHALQMAKTRAIASFEMWRAWDLTHVGTSLLIQKVYGCSTSDLTRSSASNLPYIRVTVKATAFRVVISPGPEQNELKVEKLIIGLVSEQTGGPVFGRLVHADARCSRNSTIETYCAGFALKLNWDVCQLGEDVLRQLKDNAGIPNQNAENSLEARASWGDHDLQIVMAVEDASFNFSSIHLRLSSFTRKFKNSMMLSRTTGGKSLLDGTITTEHVIIEVSKHSKILAFTKIEYPVVHVSICTEGEDLGNTNAWKLLASCREASFEIQEDISCLLGIIDHVIGDEIAHLGQIARSLHGEKTHHQLTSSEKDRSSTNEVNVILMLETYRVGILLLPSLKYVINGKVIRTSVRPDNSRLGGSVVDFDMKEHSHSLVDQDNATVQDICVLPLPPVSGQLILSKALGKLSIFAHLAIEGITLDATLLRGLFSSSMQSNLSSLQESITRDIDHVIAHYRSVLGSKDDPRRVETSSTRNAIFYTTRIVMAGLAVKANTSEEVDRFAQVYLDLGSICIDMTNISVRTQKKLEYDEIITRLREVKLLLERSTAIVNYPCGDVTFSVLFCATSRSNEVGELVRSYELSSGELEVNLYTETASMVVDILRNLQQKMKTVDLSEEIRNLRARRRMKARPRVPPSNSRLDGLYHDDALPAYLFTSMYSLEMNDIQVSWNIGNLLPISPGHESEDLVLSICKIDLATKKSNGARLMIQEFQIQMVPTSQSKRIRSSNSALLPEVIFNVAYLSTKEDRRLAFQATGKSLDLRLTSQFILPASDIQRSIGLASQELRKVVASWNSSTAGGVGEAKTVLGNKKLSSLLMDAEFGGAVVYMQGRRISDPQLSSLKPLHGGRLPQQGRYGQFTHEDASSGVTLRSPGIAWKIEYTDRGTEDPSLNAEIKIDASTNILHPTIVPLLLEISSSVKEIVGEPDHTQPSLEPKSSPHKFLDEEKLRAVDPTAILGRCRLNLGLRICRQEFSLTCQPIARVAAIAQFDDIYLTINTVQAPDQSRFFAVFVSFSQLQASVQHVYSRESTGSFEVNSIVMSLMNSKHVSSAKGISAILKISPMKVQVNAKQLQDFLLFREIWVPPEMRHSSSSSASTIPQDTQMFVVQRYQQVAAAGAFPWNATISITELNVHLDLGQSLGKSTFSISNFWVSSKKSSNWEQSLGLGFDKVGVNSEGRMSGLVELQNFRVRTSIRWLERQQTQNQTPLIQASLAFDHLLIKAAFDYQAFLVTDVSSLDFLMYNVREGQRIGNDRLVAIGSGDAVQVFCTTASAAQGLAVYQAILRLIQEKQLAYQNSLKEIEKFLRRKSTIGPLEIRATLEDVSKVDIPLVKAPIQLHTDVVITFRAINVGAFPNTFFDSQIFKLEALNASARFAVALEQDKVHSDLGLTIGQVRVALSGVTKPSSPRSVGEVSIDEVVKSATSSRGGTILKVPKVTATMQTWQTLESNTIDYIFKSLFEGKVEVGWNYNRISYIRGMWANHTRTLAQRLGKPLPQSAVRITGGFQPENEGEHPDPILGEQEKITAVVNMPQSRYQYFAIEPPIIETPQLRDMGEATPPLEWIGLQRERLPNVTHQIIIVTLLEVAKEVEDAYLKILGSS